MRLGDPRLPLLGSISTTDIKTWASVLLNRLYELFRRVDSAIDDTYKHYCLVPTALTHTVGTTTSVLSDMTAFDTSSYAVTEVAAAPAINFEVTFTGVGRIRFIFARGLYVGSSTHAVRVQLYNYTTAAYESYDSFFPSQAFQFKTIPVMDYSDYVNAAKQAKIRFYHTETGDPSHTFSLDYVAIAE